MSKFKKYNRVAGVVPDGDGNGVYKPFHQIAAESGDELLLEMSRSESVAATVIRAVIKAWSDDRLNLRPSDEEFIMGLEDIEAALKDFPMRNKLRYRSRHYVNFVRAEVERDLGRKFNKRPVSEPVVSVESSVVVAAPVEQPAMYGTW